MRIWQNFDVTKQSPDLHVIKQYVVDKQIVAQIWYHATEDRYSMNSYEDPTLIEGIEHFGTMEELTKKAEKIFC